MVALGSEGIVRSYRAARSQDKGDALHCSSLLKGLLCRKPFIYGYSCYDLSFSPFTCTGFNRATQHVLLTVQPGREFGFITPGTHRPLLQQGTIRQP